MPSDWGAFFAEYQTLLVKGCTDTMAMLFVSTGIAYVFGIVLGVTLYLTSPIGLAPRPVFNSVLGWIINMARSIPFIILLVALMPTTRAIVHTTTGVVGVVPPLVASATPFVARMIEQSLAEVPRDTLESVVSFGTSMPRIMLGALLPEALPSIVRGISITLISVLGYTAIAGAVGAGGLGDIAIRYGYYRYEDEVMLVTVILLIVLVQIIQSTCDVIAKRIDHR